jgi:hypothetical protein
MAVHDVVLRIAEQELEGRQARRGGPVKLLQRGVGKVEAREVREGRGELCLRFLDRHWGALEGGQLCGRRMDPLAQFVGVPSRIFVAIVLLSLLS